MLTILWWALVALCLCLGFLGCFINKVPGPIGVVIATLLAILCLDIPIEWSTFGIITALAIASMIVSKLLVKLVKKLQEYSKRATWGTTIGSIIGLLLVYSVTSCRRSCVSCQAEVARASGNRYVPLGRGFRAKIDFVAEFSRS